MPVLVFSCNAVSCPPGPQERLSLQYNCYPLSAYWAIIFRPMRFSVALGSAKGRFCALGDFLFYDIGLSNNLREILVLVYIPWERSTKASCATWIGLDMVLGHCAVLHFGTIK